MARYNVHYFCAPIGAISSWPHHSKFLLMPWTCGQMAADCDRCRLPRQLRPRLWYYSSLLCRSAPTCHGVQFRLRLRRVRTTSVRPKTYMQFIICFMECDLCSLYLSTIKKKMILVAVTGVRGLHHFHARNVEL